MNRKKKHSLSPDSREFKFSVGLQSVSCAHCAAKQLTTGRKFGGDDSWLVEIEEVPGNNSEREQTRLITFLV